MDNQMILKGERTDEEWAAYLKEAESNTVDSILELGRRAYEFRLACESCSGGSSFTKEAERLCGWAKTTAHRLAAIGYSSDKLSRVRETLPPSIEKLADLSQVDHLDESKLHPKITASEIRELRGVPTRKTAAKPKPTAVKEKKPSPEALIRIALSDISAIQKNGDLDDLMEELVLKWFRSADEDALALMRAKIDQAERMVRNAKKPSAMSFPI